MSARSERKNDYTYKIITPAIELSFTVPLKMVPPPYRDEPARGAVRELRFDTLNEKGEPENWRRLVNLNYYVDGTLLKYATLHMGVVAYSFSKNYLGSPVSHAKELSNYMQWKSDDIESKYQYSNGEETSDGKQVVKRSFSPLSVHPVFPNGGKRIEIQEYNIFVDTDKYICISFTITEERTNSEKKWRREIDAVVSKIRSSIIINRSNAISTAGIH